MRTHHERGKANCMPTACDWQLLVLTTRFSRTAHCEVSADSTRTMRTLLMQCWSPRLRRAERQFDEPYANHRGELTAKAMELLSKLYEVEPDAGEQQLGPMGRAR